MCWISVANQLIAENTHVAMNGLKVSRAYSLLDDIIFLFDLRLSMFFKNEWRNKIIKEKNPREHISPLGI